MGAVTAVAVLLLFVLPAEYGIDPTGAGGALGLTELAGPSGTLHSSEDVPYRNDTIVIDVAPGQGLEYKFTLAAGSGFVYSWNATASLEYDFHGTTDRDAPGRYQSASYEWTEGDRADGSFSAPFDGNHGWWFNNQSDETVTVTLTVVGHHTWHGYV